MDAKTSGSSASGSRVSVWNDKVQNGEVFRIDRAQALDCLGYKRIDAVSMTVMKECAKKSFESGKRDDAEGKVSEPTWNKHFADTLDGGVRCLEPFQALNVIDIHARNLNGSKPDVAVTFHGTVHLARDFRDSDDYHESFVKFMELKLTGKNMNDHHGQSLVHAKSFLERASKRAKKRHFMDVLLVIRNDATDVGPHVELLRVFRGGKVWHHIVEPLAEGSTNSDRFDPVYEFLAAFVLACPYAAHCMPRELPGRPVSFPAPGSFGFVIKITKEVPGDVELPPWLVRHVRGRGCRLIDFYVKYIFRGESEEERDDEGVLWLRETQTAEELARKEVDFQNRVHERLMGLEREWRPAEHDKKTFFDEFAYVPRAFRGEKGDDDDDEEEEEEKVWPGMTLRALVGDLIGSIDLNRCVVTAGCGRSLCSLTKDSDFEEGKQEEEEEGVNEQPKSERGRRGKGASKKKVARSKKGKEENENEKETKGNGDDDDEDGRGEASVGGGGQGGSSVTGVDPHTTTTTTTITSATAKATTTTTTTTATTRSSFAGIVLPPAKVGDCLERVARTMGLFHQLDMIHGDLRLPNLMWMCRSGAERRPLVSILDFGAARRLGETFKYDLRLKYLSVAHLEVLMESDEITATAKDEAESLAHLAYVSRPLSEAAMINMSLSDCEKSPQGRLHAAISIFSIWSDKERLPEYLSFHQAFQCFATEGKDVFTKYKAPSQGEGSPASEGSRSRKYRLHSGDGSGEQGGDEDSPAGGSSTKRPKV